MDDCPERQTDGEREREYDVNVSRYGWNGLRWSFGIKLFIEIPFLGLTYNCV